MKIATWNVNSIKARLPNVLTWLREANPDILLLQELKCVNEGFPAMEIEDLGYNLALHGEKTYNGVAILSKFPLEDITRTLPGDDTDAQARYIEAVASIPEGYAGKQEIASAIRIASIYVPNGQDPASSKFAYKLKFLERLYAHMQQLLRHEEVLVLGGDYNVAPYPIDVYAPAQLDGTVCYHPEERARLRSILHLGFVDAFRALHPHMAEFSWWDYRSSGWEMNKGMRIDHLLLSPQAADKITECTIDRATRSLEKTSDHAPVLATFT